jgi:trans-aconitate methyltransferase
MGRWSRIVAPEFLAWLAVAPNSRWLEIGCGTGILTQAILQTAQPAEIQAIDRAAGFIAFARAQVSDPRVRFEIADVQQLAVASAAFDAAVAGLLLNFLPDPQRTVDAMLQAVRVGGTIAAYVWDYAEHMQFVRHFWEAAEELDPEASALEQGRRFPLCRPEPLLELFRSASLQQVEVRAIDIPTHFETFESYWQPFLGGQGVAPSYVMALPEDRRIALRERLQQRLPVAPDGSIPLTARAWAVRGIR